MFLVMQDILSAFYSFLWPFSRISAALLVAPVFSARSVSIRIRLVIAVALTFVIYPLHQWPVVNVLSSSGFILPAISIKLSKIIGFNSITYCLSSSSKISRFICVFKKRSRDSLEYRFTTISSIVTGGFSYS